MSSPAQCWLQIWICFLKSSFGLKWFWIYSVDRMMLFKNDKWDLVGNHDTLKVRNTLSYHLFNHAPAVYRAYWLAKATWQACDLTTRQCQIPAWLTHWGRDKMAANFLTTFSNAFSWMKIYEFRLRFHWSLFPRVQLTIFQHWFR